MQIALWRMQNGVLIFPCGMSCIFAPNFLMCGQIHAAVNIKAKTGTNEKITHLVGEVTDRLICRVQLRFIRETGTPELQCRTVDIFIFEYTLHAT